MAESMRKTLVGLYVPAVQEQYDILLPMDMQVGEITKLLSDGVSELSNQHFVPSGLCMLTLKDPDLLLQPDKTLADYEIRDGAQIVLF